MKLSRDAQAKGSREDENWEGRGTMEVQWRYNGVHSMYNMHLYENVTKYKPILKEIKQFSINLVDVKKLIEVLEVSQDVTRIICQLNIGAGFSTIKHPILKLGETKIDVRGLIDAVLLCI